LHNETFGKNNHQLAEIIRNENPDIVIMTGDMYSHKAPNLNEFIRFCENICKDFPLYYVNGNHELSDVEHTVFDSMTDKLHAAGAVCVDNKKISISRTGCSIDIAGLCYGAQFYRGVRKIGKNYVRVTPEIIKAHLGEKSERFTVLLAHNPLDFKAQAVWGADVSFGGHVHGGVVRIPLPKFLRKRFSRVGLFSPERRFFPPYQAGLYRAKTADGVTHHLIVSRGLGRFRINNRPDVVSCTLECK
jgi:predicted MPP superfamily phosphohydrolase